MRARPWIGALLLLGLPASSAWMQQETGAKLLEARRGFETTLVRTERHAEPLAPPPPALFSIIRFRTPIGEMGAYLSRPSEEGRKHPAVIWITGGFPPGGIDASAWEPASSDNDQSAQAYRLAGVVMMYPTLRGSFGNPGVQETFYGEVDDVLAAAEYLRGVDYVDPDRIYLGGHSTGGTLALLVAAAAKPKDFRAVFAFGPFADPAGYGAKRLTYDPDVERENQLRAPIHFLGGIECPTFVIEGEHGNIESLRELERVKSKSEALCFLAVKGANHFDVLAPVNGMIAKKVAALEGDAPLELTQAELQTTFDAWRVAVREASDLRTLARLRHAGIDLSVPHSVRHYLVSGSRERLAAASVEAKDEGFEPGPIQEEEGEDGWPYCVLIVSKRLTPRDLDAVFATSETLARLADAHDVTYDGWDVKE